MPTSCYSFTKPLAWPKRCFQFNTVYMSKVVSTVPLHQEDLDWSPDQGLFLWTLHFVPVDAWIFSRCYTLTKLNFVLIIWMHDCLSSATLLQIDRLMICAGSTPALSQWLQKIGNNCPLILNRQWMDRQMDGFPWTTEEQSITPTPLVAVHCSTDGHDETETDKNSN